MHHQDITPLDFERFWSRVDTSPGINGCWRRAGTHSEGYPLFRITGRLTVRGNRFAFISIFGDLPPDQPHVLHKCPGGSQSWCTNPAHMAPGTNAENSADRVREGRSLRGDQNHSRQHPERLARGERSGSALHPEIHQGVRNGRARFTEVEILDIRARYAAGETQVSIAADKGVHQGNISAIVLRKNWKHLP